LLQARIATVTGDISAARDLCVQALDIALAQGLLDLKYRCYDLLGQIAEMAEDLDAAISYYDRAIQGIDDVQSRLVMDARTSFLEDKGAIYQRAIILALTLGQHDQALIYVEKAKSRVLGDYLRNNIDIRLRAGDKAGEAVLEDLTRLREEQAWFSSIVYDAEHEGNLSDSAVMRVQMVGFMRAQQEMQQRERQIEQLLERMQLRLVGDLVARSSPRWTDSIVTSLWPRLEETTVMLEYYMTDQDLYIFQLTRQGITVYEVPGAVKKLERLYSLWRVNLDLAGQAAGGQDRATFVGLQQNCQGLLKRFFTLLLAPVEAALYRANHAIIVPYGLLHYLPFHCFFDGNRFMVERLNFSYLPSAALLDICRQRGRRIRRRNLPLENSLVLGLSDGGRLTSAVEEAITVSTQLGAPCYLDKAATTDLVQQAGTRSPIIHIAAHGLFRLDAPNFSYIKLGDQQLSSIEVFNLDFSACSLITLSACETGRAVVSGVDEVIGLGRGFLYAGAASLLPTLWKVDDASSAELMKLFYDGLLKGQGKAAALAAAQRVFLTRARRSGRLLQTHPYFWAAFHLIGDPGLL
jgi:CHAT domain-containing protein